MANNNTAPTTKPAPLLVDGHLPAASTPPPRAVPSLFRLRLRDKHEVREVVIAASDLGRAQKVGEKYCDLHHYRYIRIEPMVVADEGLL